MNVHRQDRTLVVPFPEPLSERGLHELERTVLPQLKRSGLSSVVFDFGAVDSVDTHVLVRCEAIISEVRMLGARVVLAAMRPHVAATTIELGNFFDGVPAVRSVHTAIGLMEGSR